MAGMPAYRLVANRKDGDDITFKDHNGNEQTKKYAPVGALFPNKQGNGFNLALKKKVTLDPETFWFAMYPVEDRDDSDERPRKAAKKSSKKEEPADDDELSF